VSAQGVFNWTDLSIDKTALNHSLRFSCSLRPSVNITTNIFEVQEGPLASVRFEASPLFDLGVTTAIVARK